jgi:uroporphyrinogen decarboxylase
MKRRSDMSSNKRELVWDALNNRETERVPVGFWFHFASEKEFYRGLEDDSVVRKNIDGHLKFHEAFKPDLVKLMSDGFFGYPNEVLSNAKSARDLADLGPIGADHPWIEKQVALVKQLTSKIGSEVFTFYNIFGPATTFKFLLGKGGDGNRAFADLIAENPKAVLRAAKRAGDANILHICGYEGSRNDLSLYRDYDAKAVNWAVTVEGVSLAEGKRLFGGKAVIGGFANGKGSLIHQGSREAIEAYTKGLIAGSGRKGVIVGADCTVPSDIDLARLEWVRDAASH